MKKLKLKNSKGITLIALVVTIVVLLILAGVSINAVLGNNGLIAKAKEAREKTEQDAINTQIVMDTLYNELASALDDNSIGENGGSGDNGNGGGDGDVETLPSTEGTTPWLPDGYTRVSGTDLDTGLVIQDELGNEYVWIEVPNDGTGPDYIGAGVSKKETYTDADYTNIENALKAYTNYYRNETSYTDTYYSDAVTGLTSTEYTTLKNAMLKSVYENGGFYIGRYEAGIATNRTSKNDTIAADLKPLSKANQYPLNYVTCSQAQMLAERVAPSGYNSSLMFGVQWDLVLKYLETKGVTQSLLSSYNTDWGNYYNANFDVTNSSASYSTDKGASYTQVGSTTYTKASYSSILLTTGANETKNSKMNICDLAGNVFEWTLEYTSDSLNPCACRGGSYYKDVSHMPASSRVNYFTSDSFFDVGFRLSLY